MEKKGGNGGVLKRVYGQGIESVAKGSKIGGRICRKLDEKMARHCGGSGEPCVWRMCGESSGSRGREDTVGGTIRWLLGHAYSILPYEFLCTCRINLEPNVCVSRLPDMPAQHA